MPNFRALKVYRKQNKFDCTLFAELRDRDTRALPRNFRLFWIPKESFLKSSHPKKYLPNFPTQKNPSIIPVTWNPEYPPEVQWCGKSLTQWISFCGLQLVVCRPVRKWMFHSEYEWMKECAEEGRSTFRLRPQLFWGSDCLFLLQRFFKVDKRGKLPKWIQVKCWWKLLIEVCF